ncbi:BNR/Aspbox repeat domain containing protein [Acanthamoeba castellanii str. Neff]|uniref:BNR/Aspbox repeat domain containing protein n=1 Tax=Acanthamoeba castellanii (strain ATCC 30010 / Neff) TaxID=1257118 RepID=L8GKN9_ACACF|nr:BNR/Aspbox repeat domain containing protein [Acanthamoeba castellanii str. Neff]ELR12766.1 BNR/Aspbox repeat domain containing protein [Acanthamoeba castellanii str. Neff]
MQVNTPFLFLVLLTLACGVHSVPRPGLFSVLADRELWVFEDPTSLVTFSPSAVVGDLPLHHERIVSAVASSKPGGNFVVVGSQTVAVQRQAHRPFELAFNFHPEITLYDATNVPTTGVFVAVGVNRSASGSKEEIMFFRSEDGGFSWTSSSSWPSQSYTNASSGFSFSPSGDFGLCMLGDHMFRTVDGGRSWVKTAWNDGRGQAVSVAVLDPSLAVVTIDSRYGGGMVLISTDAGATWQPLLEANIGTGYGIVLFDRQTWVVATQVPRTGQIWRTTDGGKTWARTFAQPNTAWTGLAYNSDWGALLAVGYFYNDSVSHSAGAMALSWDMGGQWLLSGPLDKVLDRAVPGTPSL